MDHSQHSSPGYLTPSFHYLALDRGESIGRISTTPILHPRISRVKRPHTKSRRGCYSCKSRRVKCQETKPACANCIRKDIDCHYPDEDRERAVVAQKPLTPASSNSADSSSTPSASTLSTPQISLTSFTGDDLRFWHHFLVDARPHLPFGDEDSWLSTIPAFAHDCPHLLHAMLSLGASYSALVSPSGKDHYSSAIAHRSQALQSLSATIAKGADATVLEMDGALATCYTLTFQAHCMSDGIVDFAVMVRGCGLVTDWYFTQPETRESRLFKNVKSPQHMGEVITGWLPAGVYPLCEAEKIDACIAALDRLRPLIDSEAQGCFYSALRQAYAALLISHRHAFMQLVVIYAEWARMDNVAFLQFIAPGNHVSRALFMHYIVLDSFMRPVYAELMKRHNVGAGGGHFLIYRWADAIYTGLPGDMRELVEEPLGYLAMDMLPEVERHRGRYPKWEKELRGLAEWLRRRFSQDVLEMYNI